MSNPLTHKRALFTPPTTFQGASSTAEIQANDQDGNAIRLTIPALALKDRNGVIRLSGRINWAAGTLTLKVYSGLIGGTLLVTSGAVTPTASGQFEVKSEVHSDPTSDKLQGRVSGDAGVVIIPLAVISNGAFDPDTEVNLSASLQFGTSNAGNGIQVRGLELELL